MNALDRYKSFRTPLVLTGPSTHGMTPFEMLVFLPDMEPAPRILDGIQPHSYITC